MFVESLAIDEQIAIILKQNTYFIIIIIID